MSAQAPPPTSRVDLFRRDTEIAVAVFRTIFLLIVVFSPQFLYARGVGGSLLIALTVAAALYNVVLFILHMQRFPFPRPIIVVVDAVLISLWIYFAGPAGERYFVMYFAVVIVAGLWFRRGAAFAVGLFASVLYVWAVAYSPLAAGAVRTPAGTVALQIVFLMLTAGVVSIATEVQERERDELLLSRAALQQHWQRIQIAQHVDEMLRPRRLPNTPGLGIAFRFRPAAQAVSGDYYDVIPLGGRRWAIAVADVRAKGELGLFYLPLFKSALRLAARRENAPARVLTHINREVVAEMQERGELEAFIAMFYAVIDLDEGEVTYANAGMEPAVLIPAEGKEMIPLAAHGIVLGVVPEVTYAEERHPISTGDTLVVFTDGMTEVFDGRHRPLGREGLLEQIRANAQAQNAEALARAVFEEVIAYGKEGRRRDDMTLLVVRVTATEVGPRPEPSAV